MGQRAGISGVDGEGSGEVPGELKANVNFLAVLLTLEKEMSTVLSKLSEIMDT